MFFIPILADVVLEEEPWLNSSTACSFPEPFYNLSEIQEQRHRHSDLNINTSPIKLSDTTPVPKHRMEQYLGQYGNFAYGNVTVVADDILDDFIMNFESFSCLIRNATVQMLCFGLDEYWFTLIDDLIFDEVNSPSQFVDILFTPIRDYVRFERDLSLEDAPWPTDHWPQCENESPEKSSK